MPSIVASTHEQLWSWWIRQQGGQLHMHNFHEAPRRGKLDSVDVFIGDLRSGIHILVSEATDCVCACLKNDSSRCIHMQISRCTLTGRVSNIRVMTYYPSDIFFLWEVSFYLPFIVLSHQILFWFHQWMTVYALSTWTFNTISIVAKHVRLDERPGCHVPDWNGLDPLAAHA